MSACFKLINDYDLECVGATAVKYHQQAVLVNRADVDEFFITANINLNRIYFNLLAGKRGFLYRSTENGSMVSAEFTKTTKKGITLYDHKVMLPVVGVDEAAISIIKQLDLSQYFAATHFRDNTIQIHGFNYGLKTDGYTYTPQGMGGAQISLVSRYPEYDPPYIYVPTLNTGATGWEADAIEDFDNLFADIPPIFNGDFNNDFNDDFFIGNTGS